MDTKCKAPHVRHNSTNNGWNIWNWFVKLFVPYFGRYFRECEPNNNEHCVLSGNCPETCLVASKAVLTHSTRCRRTDLNLNSTLVGYMSVSHQGNRLYLNFVKDSQGKVCVKFEPLSSLTSYDDYKKLRVRLYEYSTGENVVTVIRNDCSIDGEFYVLAAEENCIKLQTSPKEDFNHITSDESCFNVAFVSDKERCFSPVCQKDVWLSFKENTQQLDLDNSRDIFQLYPLVVLKSIKKVRLSHVSTNSKPPPCGSDTTDSPNSPVYTMYEYEYTDIGDVKKTAVIIALNDQVFYFDPCSRCPMASKKLGDGTDLEHLHFPDDKIFLMEEISEGRFELQSHVNLDHKFTLDVEEISTKQPESTSNILYTLTTMLMKSIPRYKLL